MNFRFVLTALFVGGSAVGLPLTAPAQSIYDAENGRAVPESAAQIQLSFAPLVKETAPAVVNIFTRAEITRSPLGVLGDEFFNSPFGSQSRFRAIRGTNGQGLSHLSLPSPCFGSPSGKVFVRRL